MGLLKPVRDDVMGAWVVLGMEEGGVDGQRAVTEPHDGGVLAVEGADDGVRRLAYVRGDAGEAVAGTEPGFERLGRSSAPDEARIAQEPRHSPDAAAEVGANELGAETDAEDGAPRPDRGLIERMGRRRHVGNVCGGTRQYERGDTSR